MNKKKKLTGAEVEKMVREIVNTKVGSVEITGIGCGDPFGIRMRFSGSSLRMFIPFTKYYVKDLTEELVIETAKEMAFYVNQITIGKFDTSDKEQESELDLSDI